jgi:DNA replication initiation complex subunit (GINS family)
MDYNEVYEILRKEKYNEVLQELPKSFMDGFSKFLAEKKIEGDSSGDLFSENFAKSKKQLENSIALFKELMLRRKRKILNLVFVATETGIMKRDYENMLSFEREVFDKLVKAFEDEDKELGKVLSGDLEVKKPGATFRMIMFNQEVEQFVDMEGKGIGPYTAGEIANLGQEVSEILVSGGKASYVDDD